MGVHHRPAPKPPWLPSTPPRWTGQHMRPLCQAAEGRVRPDIVALCRGLAP
ncbi:hypothetical protein GZL_00303 [Streptomyces sp. 769]|nr:hypothetical protein GZL_00303 [Streptomyces sp. 769]